MSGRHAKQTRWQRWNEPSIPTRREIFAYFYLVAAVFIGCLVAVLRYG